MKLIIPKLAVGALLLGGLSLTASEVAMADTTTTTTSTPTTTTTLAPPVQGPGPINIAFQVDTVQGSSSTSIKPPVGCAQTNEFYVGQQVVFRMSAVNVAAGGVPITGANASAVINIPGVTTPINMNYGNHGTAAFWTGAWKTGGYPTMGIVHFTITVTAQAVPAVTKVVKVKTRVVVRQNGKPVVRNGKVLYRTVLKNKTVVVTPAVAGQSATYSQTGFAATSQLTLNPLPTA
jgi:hypothetical protein